jgi:Tfp pilus assembly protein PilO
MAFMADFARQPPSRKVMLFVLMGLGVGALYYQFAYKSLDEELQTVTAEHGQRAAASAKSEQDLEEYKQLKVNMPKLQCSITENAKALPTDTEVGAFFETINRKVDEAGAHVERSTQQAEMPVERFFKVPASFEITGTFAQIKKFFSSLQPKRAADRGDVEADQCTQERDRIVTIENLSLTDPRALSGALVLTARFTAATFRQEEPKEAAKPTGTTTVAPKAAPSPASPAPAPAQKLPPAATPRGAKVRVDDAMDKSEKRTDSKVGSGRLQGGQ